MHTAYELLATPYLIQEGPYKGQLKGILFVARSPANRMQWFAVNRGQFESCFSELLPDGLAAEIVENLMGGDKIAFPGRYRLEQFDGGFHFAWWRPQDRFNPPNPDAKGRFLWGGGDPGQGRYYLTASGQKRTIHDWLPWCTL